MLALGRVICLACNCQLCLWCFMTAAKLYFCWMHKNTHVCKHGFVCMPLLVCMEGFHHGHHQPRGSDLLVEHTEGDSERWKQWSGCKIANQNKKLWKESSWPGSFTPKHTPKNFTPKKKSLFFAGVERLKKIWFQERSCLPTCTARIRTLQAAAGNKCSEMLVKIWFLWRKNRKASGD